LSGASKAEKPIHSCHIKAILLKIETKLLEELTFNQKDLLSHLLRRVFVELPSEFYRNLAPQV
jgi:hypothetical protein